jgi:dienelactone hydrolase
MRFAFLATFLAFALGGCQEIPSRPGIYDVRVVPVQLSQISLPVTLITPTSQRHDGLMILFATGDDGWFFTSRYLLEHLAESGYTIAAFDSTLVTSAADSRHARVQPDQAAKSMDMLLVQAKRELGLPADTRTVITGFSRGATFVVFAAGEPALQEHIVGGVALALTLQSDYLEPPSVAERADWLQLDDEGRLLTYPAIARLGTVPIAVIQAAGDSYVPAVESRRLFGPDTATRRLYEVDSRYHSFVFSLGETYRDLDEALEWVASASN